MGAFPSHQIHIDHLQISEDMASKLMLAAVVPRYGTPDVVKVKKIPIPRPNADQVLVKVVAASLNSVDLRVVKADPFFIRFVTGLFSPRGKVLGADVAGRVVAVGNNVTRFKPGDEVFGNILERAKGMGACAEYCCPREESLELKPPNVSFQEAAAFPLGAHTAVVGFRDCIKRGDRVLVTGSSGGVGCFAVQVAKAHGAHVTAVCSTEKVNFVKSLGPDKVVDYRKVDYFKTGDKYDIIFDAAAFRSLYDGRDALKPNGTYLLVGGLVRKLIGGQLFRWRLEKDGKKFQLVSLDDDTTGMGQVREIVEQGKLDAPIDKVYPLEEIRSALWRIENREVKGKVVIAVEQS